MALASSSSAPFACRFVPRKCKHEQLFVDSYLRTNRTNHTKIMRCFPHCCPCHRKRSYCGSPLFIQLDQHRASHQTPVVTSDDLVVFGRFRPLTVSYPSLRIGAHVPLATIESSLQRDDPSSGEWVEAELSHSTHNSHDGSVSWVFEVNTSARWYYPWGGAATIALRATEHVFEVLVFRRVDAKQLELLAEATSTKFRLMSFRRGVNTETKEKSLVQKTARDEAPMKTSPPTKKAPTKKRSRQTDTEEREIKVKLKLSPKTAPAGCLSRAPSPTNTATPPRACTYESLRIAPAAVPGDVPSSLGALALWLDELPINSAGSRRLAEWEQVVMDTCADVCARTRGGVRIVRRPLTSFLSALQVSASHSPLRARQNTASPLDVIDTTIRTLLHVFIEPECGTQSPYPHGSQHFDMGATRTSTRDMGATHTSTRDQFVVMYASWQHHIEREARRFADARAHAKWADLQATATVLQHQKPALLARRGDCFGYRSFVAQRRERFAQKQLRDSETTRARQRQRLHGFSIAMPMSARAPTFSSHARVWVCRSQEVSIEMDATAMHHSLSLLALLQFWRNLSCLRLDYSTGASSGHTSQLCLASVFNTAVADECFTRLTLDGCYRWFHSLPSGEATTGTTLMGYVVGDYIGRATSAGTVHVTTYLWPGDTASTATNLSLAYAWHWTIDSGALGSVASTALSVIVESAPIYLHDSNLSFETMAIADKLRCVGRWRHTCQVQLRYHAQ